jgi:hypothetical protein
MNQKPKRLLLEALRSGKYKQTMGMMHRQDGANVDYFCALGVACDVYAKEHAMKWDVSPTGTCTLHGNMTSLPAAVLKWYGWDYALGPSLFIDGEGHSISRHNDLRGVTFEQFADAIEEQL